MLGRVLKLGEGTRILLLAPKVRAQKGEHKDLFADLLKAGFIRARVDGELIELHQPPELDRYRRHDVEVVIDRLVVTAAARSRLAESLETALRVGEGAAIVVPLLDKDSAPDAERRAAAEARRAEEDGDTADGDLLFGKAGRGRRGARRQRAGAAKRDTADLLLSAGFACGTCSLSFEPPHPQMFSFNSPQGMCTHCDGLGTRFDFDPALLVPDPGLNFLAPCIVPLRHKPGRWRKHIYEGVARHAGGDLTTPWRDLPRSARDALLYGTGDAHIMFEWRGRHGVWRHGGTFEGVIAELHAKHKKAASAMVRGYYEQFMRQSDCPRCNGARLNPQALAVTLRGRPGESSGADLNVHAICQLPISRARVFFETLELDGVRRLIAAEPLKEITARLHFLIDVGLDYLALDRPAPTLSGGESQRIRLASQIGCGLVGVLYVLDEPSIGLHPRDNRRLLASLQKLRDMGNTVVVVEHDRDTMEAADEIVDFGPGPGVRGGEIVAQGTVRAVAETEHSVTGAYLSGRRTIDVPAARRPITRPDTRSSGGTPRGGRGQRAKRPNG
jgi:excinuclease ABC subunit A